LNYIRHKNKRDKSATSYRVSHREAIRKYHKEWRLAHRESIRGYYINSRASRIKSRTARKSGTPILYRLTQEEWDALLVAWGNKCAYCRRGNIALTRDHVIPLAKGGEHTMDNVVPACLSCNSRKKDRDVVEFVMELRGV
jgi:5-methylcytosine-specific restriction endonuclease McrA